MTTIHAPARPVTDQDWRRASRMAHAFGAATAGSVALLLVTASQFNTRPVPLAVLAAVGSVFAVAGGLAADLMVRPARVRLDGGRLAVSRLGRDRLVQTDHLVGLSPNPNAAGSVVLVDAAGNHAELDVRCLARNPLIWERIDQAVSHARRTGALELAEPESAFWQSVTREVAKADQRTLTNLDFDPSP
jgi:hypothetical protein